MAPVKNRRGGRAFSPCGPRVHPRRSSSLLCEGQDADGIFCAPSDRALGLYHHLSFQRGVAAALQGETSIARRHLADAIELYESDGRDWCLSYIERSRALQEAVATGVAADLLALWFEANRKAHGIQQVASVPSTRVIEVVRAHRACYRFGQIQQGGTCMKSPLWERLPSSLNSVAAAPLTSSPWRYRSIMTGPISAFFSPSIPETAISVGVRPRTAG